MHSMQIFYRLPNPFHPFFLFPLPPKEWSWLVRISLLVSPYLPPVVFSFEGRGAVKGIDNFSSNNYQILRGIKMLVHLGIYIFVKKTN